MASELAPGSIVVTGANASDGGGALFRIDPVKGTETSVATAGDFATPIGIALEADGKILVADADAFGGAGGVIRVDPATGKQPRPGCFRTPSTSSSTPRAASSSSTRTRPARAG
jgi:hypothetical protein